MSVLQRQRRDVTRQPVDADAAGDAHQRGNNVAMLGDIDLLAQQQPRIEIADVQRSPGKRLDQMVLHRAEPVLAAEIRGNTSSNGIEFPAPLGAAVNLARVSSRSLPRRRPLLLTVIWTGSSDIPR
jgi:hypothetical protein